jgi:hypothetical protein
MNGPARLTAWASPFSVRSFMSHLRCTSAKASGAFPVLCAAWIKCPTLQNGKSSVQPWLFISERGQPFSRACSIAVVLPDRSLLVLVQNIAVQNWSFAHSLGENSVINHHGHYSDHKNRLLSGQLQARLENLERALSRCPLLETGKNLGPVDSGVHPAVSRLSSWAPPERSSAAAFQYGIWEARCARPTFCWCKMVYDLTAIDISPGFVRDFTRRALIAGTLIVQKK